MNTPNSKSLGPVYVWRAGGRAYYCDSRHSAPPVAELAERLLVIDGDSEYEAIWIRRGRNGEFIYDAVRVE